MWGFLIKGVSQKSNQQNAYGTPFIETPCIFTFLHFPCTHASKERCRKHSGYLGCTLLRPFSFLSLHLVTLLYSWLILKLQERDKWVVGACGDILYQLPISLCLCVISIAQLLYHWRSVFVFLVFVFLFILILQGTSSVSAQLLNR